MSIWAYFFQDSVSDQADYPSEDDVRDGVQFNNFGNTGNLTVPSENNVRLGISYGSDGTEFTGTLIVGLSGEVVYFPPFDVDVINLTSGIRREIILESKLH